MALFPVLGPEYYDEKTAGIRSRLERFYADNITINQSLWAEADTDLRFVCGDQTVFNDLYGNVPLLRRKPFTFNKIRPIENMITGYQRNNRKSSMATPVENGDQDTAEQFTKLFMHLNNRESILDTVSDAFEGAIQTGISFLQVWIDYRSDPISGNIRVDRCAYNSIILDSYFRKHDLSDCNGIWKRNFLTKREIISLLPDKVDDIIGLEGKDARDGKFQYMPESYQYAQNNLLTYDEYYYRDYRKQKMLVDTVTGESLEWSNNDDDRLKEFLRIYPSITVVEQDIPTVKLAILVQGRLMYDGPNPTGDTYPFIPVFAFFNPDTPYYHLRIQSMTRGLRDAQYLYNRRKNIELDILESQVNSGFIYKENALVNPKDIFMQGQGKGIALKEDANIADVQQIQAAQIPPSMLQLSEALSRELREISGVNEELLGAASDDKAGILSMLRQGAGLTTLQGLFDQLDKAQKQLYGKILNIIQTHWTPGKVKRILEEQPTQQFYDKNFGKYDVVIEDGFNTSTQRQLAFAQLLHLRESGVQIPDEILLEEATIQNKSKVIKAVAENARAAQEAQQMQQQVAMEEQQARTNLAKARTVADEGLGIERLSRVKENEALADERRAQSSKDRASGLLDLARTLKELDDIDIRQIEKLLNLSTAMRKQEELEKASRESMPKQPLAEGVVAQAAATPTAPTGELNTESGKGQPVPPVQDEGI